MEQSVDGMTAREWRDAYVENERAHQEQLMAIHQRQVRESQYEVFFAILTPEGELINVSAEYMDCSQALAEASLEGKLLGSEIVTFRRSPIEPVRVVNRETDEI